MTCDYCFYCDEAKKRTQHVYGMMNEKTLETIIEKTISEADAVASFTWQGGEPTLRGIDFFEKAVALQKKYKQQYQRNNLHIMNSFQTNGYELDRQWAKFFKRNQFLVGLSIDGFPEIHDLLRRGKDGSKSFFRVKQAADLLDQYEVDYNILTVVTSQVAERIKEIYPFYKKCGWNYQQYIACLEPFGEKTGTKPYSLSSKQYGKFLSNLFELWYHDLQGASQPYIRQFENYVGLAAGYMAESCEQRGCCGVQYAVEADGSVYPCDFYVMDEYQIGNFNTDSFDQMDQKRSEIRFIEQSSQVEEACISCPYFLLCRGGCRRNRGNGMQTEPTRNNFCEGYKIFFEKWYDTLMQLGKLVQR